jgi:predicted nucleic acid-binding protein
LDEHEGRVTATSFGLKPLGVLGILLQARSKGLIPMVRPLLEALITRAGFWVSRKLYEGVLTEAREL